MEIKSIYSWSPSSSISKRSNSPLLPQSLRGLIVGKSSSGKTTVLLNLLLQPNWLDFNHLYVFGLSLHQTEYQLLRKGFNSGLSKEQISNLFSNQSVLQNKQVSPITVLDEYSGPCNGTIKAEFYDDCSKIPDPSELNVDENNLIIFDDCILQKQNKAEAYYTRGRHNNCDTLYISQNYFMLPRRTVRENANFILLFKQDIKNVNCIYGDHCSYDMTLEEFHSFCKTVWESDTYNFVTLDLTSTKCNGKYRKNLDDFYIPLGYK